MEPIIYKLKYETRSAAITDLVSKGVIDAEENYLPGTHAVVHLANLTIQDAILDNEGTIIEPAIISNEWHIDIMVNEIKDFGSNQINPQNPKHNFA